MTIPRVTIKKYREGVEGPLLGRAAVHILPMVVAVRCLLLARAA